MVWNNEISLSFSVLGNMHKLVFVCFAVHCVSLACLRKVSATYLMEALVALVVLQCKLVAMGSFAIMVWYLESCERDFHGRGEHVGVSARV